MSTLNNTVAAGIPFLPAQAAARRAEGGEDVKLLSGTTGEEGGHDWIYLFSSVGLLQRAQSIAALTHTVGAMVVLLALGWAARVLVGHHRRGAGVDL